MGLKFRYYGQWNCLCEPFNGWNGRTIFLHSLFLFKSLRNLCMIYATFIEILKFKRVYQSINNIINKFFFIKNYKFKPCWGNENPLEIYH